MSLDGGEEYGGIRVAAIIYSSFVRRLFLPLLNTRSCVVAACANATQCREAVEYATAKKLSGLGRCCLSPDMTV